MADLKRQSHSQFPREAPLPVDFLQNEKKKRAQDKSISVTVSMIQTGCD